MCVVKLSTVPHHDPSPSKLTSYGVSPTVAESKLTSYGVSPTVAEVTSGVNQDHPVTWPSFVTDRRPLVLIGRDNAAEMRKMPGFSSAPISRARSRAWSRTRAGSRYLARTRHRITSCRGKQPPAADKSSGKTSHHIAPASGSQRKHSARGEIRTHATGNGWNVVWWFSLGAHGPRWEM